MAYPKLETGRVVAYAYLWNREHEHGAEEGLKDRPCVILGALGDEGAKTAFVLPITHAEPEDKRHAVEIPPKVKQYLGLDESRSWIMCNEVNAFAWPGFDLLPLSPHNKGYGILPPTLFKSVKEKYSACIERHSLKVVSRDPRPLRR